ncbi:TRAP transporter small permease [Salinisphaera sp. T31B1]|uniref:TRAP transporter small permease n=1 Tax=Salinisphaera sp. T31B1 TaxID=727963 RepID=UPI003341C8C2
MPARLSLWLGRAVKSVIALSMLAILIIVCVQVFCRFVLDDALSWPEEAARFLMVWGLMLGGAFAFLDGEHTGIQILAGRLKGRAAIANSLVVHGLILGFLGCLIYGGWQEMSMLMRFKTGALGISKAIPYGAIPISAALYGLFAIVLVVRRLRREQGR